MSMHSIRLALVATVLGLSTAAQKRRARKARATDPAPVQAGASPLGSGNRDGVGEAPALRTILAPRPVGPLVAEPA